jgi:hypothetical protein
MGLVEKACGVGGLEHDPLVFWEAAHGLRGAATAL